MQVGLSVLRALWFFQVDASWALRQSGTYSQLVGLFKTNILWGSGAWIFHFANNRSQEVNPLDLRTFLSNS